MKKFYALEKISHLDSIVLVEKWMKINAAFYGQ